MSSLSPHSQAAVRLVNIKKTFSAVIANNNVNLEIPAATIHGIIGENGAGKSTLMSILFGFYQADSGDIFIHGKKLSIASSRDAIERGIGMVHQHFMLIGPLTVLENILLGAEGGMTLAHGETQARAALQKLAKDYALEVPLDCRCEELTVGQQQRVEILKALYRGADILILDEPTGVLTPAEADHLFNILRQLKAQGKTVVLITHKLREIMAITDNVSVMRRGEMITTLATKDATTERLAETMVGRNVTLNLKKTITAPGRTVLGVLDLTVIDAAQVTRVKSVSFQVRAGEIVGIAGVAGNGQSELLDALTGLCPWQAGEIEIDGAKINPDTWTPAHMRARKVAHVPEDRHKRAMVMGFDASENAILGYEDEKTYGSGPFLDKAAVARDAAQRMQAYDIRPCSPHLRSDLFSGGNQQKLVLARELMRQPELLIIGQPTRGVDIGAIEFIHKQLLALRDAGKAILLVSVELDEIRSLSDRVLVMFDGGIIGECQPNASERDIGRLMAGVTKREEGQAA